MIGPFRFQFTLRTLLAIVTVVAVASSCIKMLGLELVAAFSGLGLSFIFVVLVALALLPLERVVDRLPYAAVAIATPIFYGALALIFYIFGEAIDQPHPGVAVHEF
jgi:hypothetical protein